MSAFDEPKETPIPNIDEEGNLELLDAEDDNQSEANEEVEKPTFDLFRQYHANENYLCSSMMVSPYANELSYEVRHQATLVTYVVCQVKTLTKNIDTKMDIMITTILNLTNVINTQAICIASMEQKISSLQAQNPPHQQQYHYPYSINVGAKNQNNPPTTTVTTTTTTRRPHLNQPSNQALRKGTLN